MGLMGRYIDTLPSRAKDRVIEAQEWCVAEVHGPNGARCLIGHAEDWHPFPAGRTLWQRWRDGGREGEEDGPDRAPQSELEALCSPEFFAFRRVRPLDLDVYRDRVRRWGLGSESRIGARFDRLCIRRGLPRALHLVKARAARSFAPPSPPASRPVEVG